ncbi:MAG TPA: HAMP domain-containing sensor histidine kinase [Bacteroidales bacterium]|nr:HAMP domain-containing sensor histidine kinase [Bacteroidales bacterium]HPJ59815.1 HAMP domain-containing sensor histidine kinase [Bacteroidales bacterium]HPR13043.1 HAMP domain-containing sensor histidine kinase [Bacteroidales bacterium]
MQRRNTVLLLGILAIVLIVVAQVIILRGLWNQQNEMLTLRYRSLAQEANASLRGSGIETHDTVMFILNQYSEKIRTRLASITDTQELEVTKKEVLEYFTTVIEKEQDFTSYLSGYFRDQGFEEEFNHRIAVSNLEISISDTSYMLVHRSDSYLMPGEGRPVFRTTDDSKSRISVLRQRLWGNYFYLQIEYFIDFSDKQRLILRETAASLGMSLFSLIVVVIIFLVTYRNLMEEKRLSNLKTDFINNMTHELKTPLATITVAGKTLEMEKIRKDELKILDTAKLIGKQSVHLNQLINMILEISMWERTEFQLDKKQVNIEELMNDIVNGFKTGLGNSATLTQKYDFSNTNADVDVVYFTTLINNLLSNAVKYSDKDPVINVEGSVENRSVRINVADNGIGISKADQKHVFDKFYRASSGNIHKYKGLGLGLYYVKKIAVAHGGDVTVSSKPGKGSIFTVTIPI